jgi:hypothetical protein
MAKSNKKAVAVLTAQIAKHGDVLLSEALARETGREGGRPRALSTTDQMLDFYLWIAAFQAAGLSLATAGRWRGLDPDKTYRRHRQARRALAGLVEPHLEEHLQRYVAQQPWLPRLIDHAAKTGGK